MKRALLSTVASLAVVFSQSALASKARVQSLLGANHLVDTQTVFTSPSHIHLLSPYMTFEMGGPGTSAEGGLVKDLGNGQKLLIYLGHQNPTNPTDPTFSHANVRASNGYLLQRNPLEVIYGFGDMAFGASFSTADNKQAGTKETTGVVKFGMNFDDSWVYAHVHALNDSKNAAGDKINTAPHFTVGGSHVFGSDYRLFGEVNYGAGEVKPAAGGKTDVDDMFFTLGVEDRSLKTDIADIYYGLKVLHGKRDFGATEQSETRVPAFIGIEYFANDWAIVRASFQQNILLGNQKFQTAATDKANAVPNDNQVAAGLGFKYKNFLLDGSLAAATTGNINGSSFLTQASLTYTF